MRKLLITLMLGAAMIAPAYADITCGRAMVEIGASGNNPVVSTTVSITDHVWSVLHTLRDGTVVDRSLQYVMVDQSNEYKVQWRGPLVTNPNLVMIGEVKVLDATGQPVYHEWLYDYGHGGRLVMHSMALCRNNPVPAYTTDQPSE